MPELGSSLIVIDFNKQGTHHTGHYRPVLKNINDLGSAFDILVKPIKQVDRVDPEPISNSEGIVSHNIGLRLQQIISFLPGYG